MSIDLIRTNDLVFAQVGEIENQAGKDLDSQEVDLEPLKIAKKIQTVKKHKEWFNLMIRLDSYQNNYIDCKNLRRYIIGTVQDKLLVFDEGTQVYSQYLTSKYGLFEGVAYIGSLNAYLLHLGARCTERTLMNSSLPISGDPLQDVEGKSRVLETAPDAHNFYRFQEFFGPEFGDQRSAD